MAILGGASTLTGPIVGAVIITLVKNVVSTYVERWNTLLGAIFVIVIMFMPYGLVPGVRQLWRRWRRAAKKRSAPHDARARSRLESGLNKRFGGLPATQDVSLTVMPGERRLIIGPNGAGKTTLFNLVTGDLTPDTGSVKLFGQELLKLPTQQRVHLGLARTYQILTLFPQETLVHNVVLALLGLDKLRWNVWTFLSGQRHLYDAAREALAQVGLAAAARTAPSRKPPTASGAGSKWRWRWRRSRRCCCSTSRSRACRQEERSQVRELLARVPRDVTIVMIEHDMDSALAFAERITLLHYGEVIVEGTRAEVVADPRTKEVYLGE